MQPLPVNSQERKDYHEWLRTSHDFDIEVQILDLDEKPIESVHFLDGQVNLNSDQLVRRTASLTLSDPESALVWTGSPSDSEDRIWPNRLIRVRHSVIVPTVGKVTATPFIGCITSLDRKGGEVTLECQDKSVLGVRGSKPMTVKKGRNAVDAIKAILRQRTGEFRFRFPNATRRLSRDYSVGWKDETSPWKVATTIARKELGRQLIYSCDGYATIRRKPTGSGSMYVQLTDYPSNAVDFTEMNNYVRALGKKWDKKGLQLEGAAKIGRTQPLSPEKLARKGVSRFWPEVIEDSEWKTKKQVEQAAADRLADTDKLDSEIGITCVPLFHGDVDDLFTITLPDGTHVIRLRNASIPLGVGGDMTIGQHKWVSRAPKTFVWSKKVRYKKAKKKKG